MHSRQNMLWLGILCAAGLALPSSGARPPHLVVAVGDDLGTYDVGAYRGGRIPTPTLDALVADGLVMDSFYVYQICSPTRSALITGRYPFHVSQALPEGFHGIDRRYKTIADILKLGPTPYRSYHTGKWHMGFFNDTYTPRGRGFDEAFGFLGAIHNVTHWNQWGGFTTTSACTGHDIWASGESYPPGPQVGREGTYSAELYGNAAVQYVRHHAKSYPGVPMYLQAEYFVPHGPTDPAPPAQFMPDISHNLTDRTRANYTGMVVALDSAVGNLVEALRETGMWNTTLFLLFGDNGGAVPDGGRNWPLRGCKWTRWEGGVRMTALWAGGALPPLARGARTSGLASIADVLPTLADFAGLNPATLNGLNPEAPVPLDGVSLKQFITDPQRTASPRTEVLIDGAGWQQDPARTTFGTAIVRDSPVDHATRRVQSGGGRPMLSVPHRLQDGKNPTCGGVAVPDKPNGIAWGEYRTMQHFPLPDKKTTSIAACATACCNIVNCTHWAVTLPKIPRSHCSTDTPCCFLVHGGSPIKSQDTNAYSGTSSNCDSDVPTAPSGTAWHNFKSMQQFALADNSKSSASACALACCNISNCTGWAVTRPKYAYPACKARAPCCFLVNGGTLDASYDGSAWSGRSRTDAPPSPPSPPSPLPPKAGAVRVGDWKLIVGESKYPDWYPAPEDTPSESTALARKFCKLTASEPFPPPATPCSPYCLFNLETDPCETKNLAESNFSQLSAMVERFRVLSQTPVPYDSCLPGCTAQMGCAAAADRYSTFFGPYYPPISHSSHLSP